MRTLFLAWQDPVSRRWFPVGRLDRSDAGYLFSYIKGAGEAQREAGFQLLPSFPDLSLVYESARLFPLFSNRTLQPSRGDYREYMKYLDLPETERDPLALLSRSGGRRVTDTLEVFPLPEQNDAGEYEILFPLHGLSHVPEESANRALRLKRGERLLVMLDVQNPKDSRAIALRTAEQHDRDLHLVGYCPRYLSADFHRLLGGGLSAAITVQRVNPPPAPLQVRVLCKATMRWPRGFKPFDTPAYEPISAAVPLRA